MGIGQQMAKSQRTKGATYEREIANALTSHLGTRVTRNITQVRDGGIDIECGPFAIECKRRKSLPTVEAWLTQAEVAAAKSNRTPVVVARQDNGKSLVIMRFDDWVQMAEDASYLISTNDTDE